MIRKSSLFHNAENLKELAVGFMPSEGWRRKDKIVERVDAVSGEMCASGQNTSGDGNGPADGNCAYRLYSRRAKENLIPPRAGDPLREGYDLSIHGGIQKGGG